MVEIVKSDIHTRQWVEQGQRHGLTLLDCIKAGSKEGMQSFDEEIEKLVLRGIVDLEAAVSSATNPSQLRHRLGESE